jgi:hypothetical protein
MAKKFTPDAECVKAADEASGGELTRDEIDAAFDAINDFKEQLEASGNIAGMGDKLRSFAARQAERTKFAAAVRKRHAALDILIKDRQEAALDALMKAGLAPREAMLAIMEGTQKGVQGARKSVYALNLAYEARYAGGLMSDLQKGRPHVVAMLGDAKFDADVVREMLQQGDGGKPGITGNADARFVAETFAAHAERARVDLNSLGATIGKLNGWFGVQQHDDLKMLRAGKSAWIKSILPKLDIARTFPDGPPNLVDTLGKLYDEAITGFPADEIDAAIGSRVHPANLAKQLGVHRVLHFKDAESALAYRDEFGHGNTFTGMVSYLRNAARSAALMEALGPNPRSMFETLVNNLRKRVADDPAISDKNRAKWTKQLDAEAGALAQSLDIATGAFQRPVNVTGAQIGASIRSVENMAKLGLSMFSSLADAPAAAAASMFRGTGYWRALTNQLGAIVRGRPKAEVAEISYVLGEGFDGIIGHIVTPMVANDGPAGFLAKMQQQFFKFNGQTWWSDTQRAAAGRMIAAEMGMRAGVTYDALPDAYRHVLGLHGIDEARWNVIRKAVRTIEGKQYVTPEMIRTLPDDDIVPFTTFDFGDNAATRAAKMADARRGLELDLLRFVADEVNYGVVEPDARSRRFMTRGTRPGTLTGELLRFLGQFKGFPVTFTQRVLGRSLYGHRKGAGFIERSGHIGALIAGMTVAGYVRLVVGDLSRGQWPPRDPTDPKTIAAAMMQGGAAGIYGDFLFGEANRYGGGYAETAVGPALGALFQLGEVATAATRDQAVAAFLGQESRMPAAEALSLAVQNTPFASLIFVRPALDVLFLNSLREAVSPGYLRRQERRRLEEYGQRSIWPTRMQEALR